MPQFTPDEVRRLARLARLELDADEIVTFTAQLSEILAFAGQVQAVDTSTATGEAADAPSDDPLRDDLIDASLPRDEVFDAAPGCDRTTGLITVPRVIAG